VQGRATTARLSSRRHFARHRTKNSAAPLSPNSAAPVGAHAATRPAHGLTIACQTVKQISAIQSQTKTVADASEQPSFAIASSRLVFRHEFERQLHSDPLKGWFDAIRCRNDSLASFLTTVALRDFLHSSDREDTSKPEIWRTLVKELQRHWTPEAVMFVVGLLEPAMGALVDRFNTGDLDSDDLWQEAVACAIDALGNPKVVGRNVVLGGLKWDTFYRLRHWLRAEFRNSKREAPLFDELPYLAEFDTGSGTANEEMVLADWCHRARIKPGVAALIFATRIEDMPLSHFAPHGSRRYYRLHKQITRAEARLKDWLLGNGSLAKTSMSTNGRKTHSLMGDARTGSVDPDSVPSPTSEAVALIQAMPRRKPSQQAAGRWPCPAAPSTHPLEVIPCA
jgi:hypothetical protein